MNKTAISLLGNTPIIKLGNMFSCNVYAKLEYYNPTFSIKDRASFNMIKRAYEMGIIKEGGTIIEATSGNTGLGICFAAIIFNLNVVCVVFDEVPIEKINLLKAYGAVVVICSSEEKSDSDFGYVGVARKMAEKLENSFYVNQFSNFDNVLAHYEVTGPELLKQMNNKIDYFFSTIGTGGTISGVGKYLKENKNQTKIIGVEPKGGIYRDFFYRQEYKYKDHLIQSISDDFISDNFKKEYIDEIVQVSDQESFSRCYEVLKKEGICIGTSGGTVLSGVNQYIENNHIREGANILCIIPDLGIKYCDTLFNNEYLKKNNIQINLTEKELCLYRKIDKYRLKNKLKIKIY